MARNVFDMTFLCPELKRRLLGMGKTSRPDITDIDNLMVEFTDEEYRKSPYPQEA